RSRPGTAWSSSGLVVLAAQDHHRPMAAGAGEVAVLQGVAAAVEARPLAIPERDGPIESRVGVMVEHLGAGHGLRGQLLVGARNVHDVVLLEQRASLPEGDDSVRRCRRSTCRPIAGRAYLGVEVGGGGLLRLATFTRA